MLYASPPSNEFPLGSRANLFPCSASVAYDSLNIKLTVVRIIPQYNTGTGYWWVRFHRYMIQLSYWGFFYKFMTGGWKSAGPTWISRAPCQIRGPRTRASGPRSALLIGRSWRKENHELAVFNKSTNLALGVRFANRKSANISSKRQGMGWGMI